MADATLQNQYVGSPTIDAGNPQVITVQQNQQQGADRRPKYKRAIYGLGVAKIVLGSVSISLGILTLIVASTDTTYKYYGYSYYGSSHVRSYQHGITYISQGIWAGVFPVVSGILGCAVKNHPSACIYNANLGMSIIAPCAMLPLIALSGIAASYYSTPYGEPSLAALHSLLAIVGFAALVICIVHSAYCCRTFDCCQSRQLYNGPVMYNTQPYGVQQPQQMMVQLANGQFMMVPSQSMAPGYLAAPVLPGPMMYQQPQRALPGQQIVGQPQGVCAHPVTPPQLMYQQPHEALLGQQIVGSPQGVSAHPVTPTHPIYENQPAFGGYTAGYSPPPTVERSKP